MASTLCASSTPPIAPSSVPTTPMMLPCTMKIPIMLPGSRQRAQDGDFGALVGDDHDQRRHMLKAATATISSMITNITVFSILSARKNWRARASSRAPVVVTQLFAELERTQRRAIDVVDLESRPLTCPSSGIA